MTGAETMEAFSAHLLKRIAVLFDQFNEVLLRDASSQLIRKYDLRKYLDNWNGATMLDREVSRGEV